MRAPTIFFGIAIFTLALLVLSAALVVFLHNREIDRQAMTVLDPPMCINETGAKRVPCPTGENQ